MLSNIINISTPPLMKHPVIRRRPHKATQYDLAHPFDNVQFHDATN